MDVTTRQQIWKDIFGNTVEKSAELAQTYDMPGSAPQQVKLKDRKSVIKTAEEDLLKLAFESALDTNEEPVKGEQPASLPQAESLKPLVDTCGKDAPKAMVKKEAQYYALPSQKRYPLDGYDQVKTASAYFDEWHKSMPPEMKMDYAYNLVKRASAIGVPTSELAQHYGGGKAGAAQIKIAFDARRSVLLDEGHKEVLDKLASDSNVMNAELLATCLTEFDRMAGLDVHWGGDIPDPYFSVFSKTAEEQESETDPNESIIVGNEYITKRKLVEFSKLRQPMIERRFGVDFALEFIKDPSGIFESLPRDQKLVVMRMANTSAEGASAS